MSDRGIKKWNPFKALIGHEDIIKAMLEEKKKVPKPVISPDKIEELNRFIQQVEENDILYIKYYDDGFIKEENLEYRFFDIESKSLVFEDLKIKTSNVLDLDYQKEIEETK